MKIIDYKTLDIKPHNILFATTSDQDYSMERTFLLDISGTYVIVSGSHCSCYGFDETEWEAIEYTKEELKQLPLDYGDIERELKLFIKRYFR